MTNTEFMGLVALTGCLVTMGAWLQLRRATPAERRKKRTDFRLCLFGSAAFIGLFGLNFILPMPVPPSLAEWVFMSLIFLLILWIAISELRIAFRARNADDQRAPADSDT